MAEQVKMENAKRQFRQLMDQAFYLRDCGKQDELKIVCGKLDAVTDALALLGVDVLGLLREDD